MSEQFTIEEARRDLTKLRLAITGSTGAGKTYTALKIATRLSGNVCLIDTENRSASKYGGGKPFTFKTLVLQKPYSLARYIAAIQFVEKQGFPFCVIDSLTHAWAGAGGALEAVDDAARKSRAGNSYTAWRDVTPMHRLLIETILGSNMHIIATMRSKMDFVQEKDSSGRTIIRKVGLAPVQRDDMAYEFDVVGDMDSDHVMVINKSRCSEIDGTVIHRPGDELADALKAWLSDGEPHRIEPEPEPAPAAEPTHSVCAGPEGPQPFVQEYPPEGSPALEAVFEPPAVGVPTPAWSDAWAGKLRVAREAVGKQLGVAFTADDTRKWLNRTYGLNSHKEATQAQLEALRAWMLRVHRAGRMVE